MRKTDEKDVKLGITVSNWHFTRFASLNMDQVQLGVIVSRDPVRQANTMTESTTPFNADLDTNAMVWS